MSLADELMTETYVCNSNSLSVNLIRSVQIIPDLKWKVGNLN